MNDDSIDLENALLYTKFDTNLNTVETIPFIVSPINKAIELRNNKIETYSARIRNTSASTATTQLGKKDIKIKNERVKTANSASIPSIKSIEIFGNTEFPKKIMRNSFSNYTKQSILSEKNKSSFAKCFEINKHFFLKNNPSIISDHLEKIFIGCKMPPKGVNK